MNSAGSPDVGDVPLVSDMSSNLLSRPLDVGRFGLIYAGAQKNIGPAGLALVIVREDLIGLGEPTPPAMLDYATHVKARSLYNTPPTYAVYVAGLVFQWLQETGGLVAAEQRNIAKAALLYDFIDSPTSTSTRWKARPVANERSVSAGEFRAGG